MANAVSTLNVPKQAQRDQILRHDSAVPAIKVAGVGQLASHMLPDKPPDQAGEIKRPLWMLPLRELGWV